MRFDAFWWWAVYISKSVCIHTYISTRICLTPVVKRQCIEMHFDAWLYWSVNLYIHTTKYIYTVIHKSPTYVVKCDYIHAFMQVGCIFPSKHGTEVAYTYNPSPILQKTYLLLLYLWTICICICIYKPWTTSPSWFRHT